MRKPTTLPLTSTLARATSKFPLWQGRCAGCRYRSRVAQATIERGLALLPELLLKPTDTPQAGSVEQLGARALECGGSDAFSGLTANPCLVTPR